MVRLWVSGLAWSRSGCLLGTIAGVALAVALLASLGTFLGTSAVSMTARAIASIPVDWQVQMLPGANPNQAEEAARNAAPILKAQRAGFADVTGLEAVPGGSAQATGP